MNALAKESNVKDSLKKYFVDALGDIVTFDLSLKEPDIRKSGSAAIKQWYNVSFGQFGRNALADYTFEVYCLSRQDTEGILLSVMTDVLFNLLVDSTKTDGMRRIPIYDTENIPWNLIGAMVIQEIGDNVPFQLPEDETKIKIYSVRLRWGLTI
jgi:hypothetical protein